MLCSGPHRKPAPGPRQELRPGGSRFLQPLLPVPTQPSSVQASCGTGSVIHETYPRPRIPASHTNGPQAERRGESHRARDQEAAMPLCGKSAGVGGWGLQSSQPQRPHVECPPRGRPDRSTGPAPPPALSPPSLLSPCCRLSPWFMRFPQGVPYRGLREPHSLMGVAAGHPVSNSL